MDRSDLIDSLFIVLRFLVRNEKARGIEEVGTVVKIFSLCNRLFGKRKTPKYLIRNNDVLDLSIKFLKERLNSDHFYLFSRQCLKKGSIASSCSESPYYAFRMYYRNYLESIDYNLPIFHVKVLRKMVDKCLSGRMDMRDLAIINNDISDTYFLSDAKSDKINREYKRIINGCPRGSFCEYCGTYLNLILAGNKMLVSTHYCSILCY